MLTRKALTGVGALERGEIPLMPIEPANVKESKPLTKRGKQSSLSVKTRGMSWKEGWEWSTVQGAEGWWQILMPGVWVDGSRVLQNQAVVLDVRPYN